jgi:multidrug resistance efflux pump
MRRACGLALLAACGGGAGPAAGAAGGPRVERVTRGELVDRVLMTGTLEPAASIELSVPRTDAWQLTIRWMAEDGTKVHAGDRLLEFDNTQFTTGLEQKRLAADEAGTQLAALREMNALSLAVKQAELEQARIALGKAALQAKVPSDLVAARDAQARQLEQARAELEVSKAEQALTSERRSSALDLQVKQLAFDKATRAIAADRKALQDLVLTAPRDGIALVSTHPWEGRPFHVGDVVQPGMRLMSMPERDAPMIVRASLSDVDDGRVAPGMRGTCTLDAYPALPLACTLTELAAVAGTPDERSLRRAFAATLSLTAAEPPGSLPGMSVRVELAVPHGPPGLVAPRGAVVFGDTPKLRLAGGELRAVTLGDCDAQRCAIVAGAREGEAVQIGGS